MLKSESTDFQQTYTKSQFLRVIAYITGCYIFVLVSGNVW